MAKRGGEVALTEKSIQAILMNRAMIEQQHEFILPNSQGYIYMWEADLLTMTRARYIHEYEIKCSIYDYRAEFKHKAHKHQKLRRWNMHVPNYFWFVTYDFYIRPPDHCGWIYVDDNSTIHVKKKAPLLHKNKFPIKYEDNVRRMLSYRLMNLYGKHYLNGKTTEPPGEEANVD
jgi:hypothetical protein